MKNKTTIGLLAIAIVISPLSTRANYETTNKEDTVVIELGEKSKIIIFAASQEDLKDVASYDINAMLDALNSTLDSANSDTDEIILTDDSGVKYIKDTTEKRSSQLKYYGDDGDDSYVHENNSYEWSSAHESSEEVKPSNSKQKRTHSSFQMELGMNNWLEDGAFPDGGQSYAIKPLGSWYVGLGVMNYTRIAGSLGLLWGGNISWYNWKMQDASVRIEKTDLETTFTPDPTVSTKKSKLAATYINAMLVPVFSFGQKSKSGRYSSKGFRIGAGMYAGYRVDSWTRFIYYTDGDKRKDKNKDNYYLNDFRYGARAQLGFRDTDFFVNYDLNTVFSDARGPKLNAISFGFVFVMD